ncbi:MAG TPA: aminodeoxychorismate synthase, component I, partial [Desulfotomaculum sp.]|nr:aminodeoxychorismate synthase, component I [Desulfotomaculum sp.]
MPFKLPLYRHIPAPAGGAPAILERLKALPCPFLLDTGMLVEGLGHHSFVGSDPFLVLKARGQQITVTEGDKSSVYNGDPMVELGKLLARYKLPVAPGPYPFNGGAVGYFSYDLGRRFEVIPSLAVDDLATPDLCLGFYDVVVAVDVRTGEVTVISTGLPERGSAAVVRAQERLATVTGLLTAQPSSSGGAVVLVCDGKTGGLVSNFTPDAYREAVQRAVDYIYAGDIFQVNISQRFSAPQVVDAWSLYTRLRKINPAPFAAFLSYDDLEVISASPERFLKLEGSRVETCPIKGTRPRGRTPEDDEFLRQELLDSEKDRAELMMIVDLERNDLGRVCEVGSVKVPELYRLEEYATVFHLVSTVEGRLHPEKDITDLLAASFPGGSITGAPKIRAMEIIEEMEPVRRGVYTGSIGYISFDGRVDLNIVIRTILATKGNFYFQVGGGITADSDPQREYVETLDKARAL